MNPDDTTSRPDSTADSNQKNALPGDVADLLVSRVVDGVATERDWNAFQNVAGSDIAAWRELAMTLGAAQRDQTSLSQAVEAHAAVAQQIGLPSEDAAMVIPMSSASRAWSFARGGLGWVAAAVLALAIYTGRFNQASRNFGPASQPAEAGIGSSLTDFFNKNSTQPRDILDGYIDRGMETGEVLGELPDKLMVQAQPVKLEDGSDGYEVIFVRQILERTKLPNLYQMQVGPRDELGRGQVTTVPMRISKPRKGSM